ADKQKRPYVLGGAGALLLLVIIIAIASGGDDGSTQAAKVSETGSADQVSDEVTPVEPGDDPIATAAGSSEPMVETGPEGIEIDPPSGGDTADVDRANVDNGLDAPARPEAI